MSYEDDLKYADAIRAMIGHETDVVSNRMNWLILLQALLFTAVADVRHDKIIVTVVAALGCVIAVSMRTEFLFSERAIAEILRRWDGFKAYRSARSGELPDLPPAFAGANCERSAAEKFLAARRLLPMSFTAAWLAIAIYYAAT